MSADAALWTIASAAILALVAVALTNTAADPDLWGHVRFGRDIVSAWRIPAVDPYSFTSDRAWVNHEWLAEALMFVAYRTAGSAGLIVLKLLLLAGTVTALVWSLARQGAAAGARHVLLLLAILGMFLRIQAVRPQLFSILLFAWLLFVMRDADRGRLRALVGIPLIVSAWVNLHGGWIVGIGVWGCWCVARLVDRRASMRTRAMVAMAGVGALLATLINPYGVGLWRFLWDTVSLSRPDIQDWLPVYRVSAGVWLPWAVLTGLAIAALAMRTQPRRGAYAVIVGLLAIGTFRVSRLDAFFALAVVGLLGEDLVTLGRGLVQWLGVEERQSRSERPRLAAGLTVAATALLVGAASLVVAPNLGCIKMLGDWLPETDMGQLLQAQVVRGRVMTWFGWGEYAIWFGGPDLRVSLDGRRETVYSAAVVDEQFAFFRGERSAANLPDLYAADWIWLPTSSPQAPLLEARGWHITFEGPTSTLLSRAPGPTHLPMPGAAARRCFPGP